MKRLFATVILLAGAAAFGQSYSGFLDQGDCSALAGWAWDSTRPSSPMNVDLYDGSTLIETVAANLTARTSRPPVSATAITRSTTRRPQA